MTAPFLSYWNGKSLGRLAEPGLRPCGVHFFAAARGDAARCDAQDAADGLVLLHYPFCHFPTWRRKFNILDATQRSDWGHYKDARLRWGVAAFFTGAPQEPRGLDAHTRCLTSRCVRAWQDRSCGYFRASP